MSLQVRVILLTGILVVVSAAGILFLYQPFDLGVFLALVDEVGAKQREPARV